MFPLIKYLCLLNNYNNKIKIKYIIKNNNLVLGFMNVLEDYIAHLQESLIILGSTFYISRYFVRCNKDKVYLNAGR